MNKLLEVVKGMFGLALSCFCSVLGSYALAMFLANIYAGFLEPNVPREFGKGTVMLATVMGLYITIPTYGFIHWKARRTHKKALTYALLGSGLFTFALCTWEYLDTMLKR